MKKLILICLFLLLSLTISAADKTYTITWEANSEPDISHYIVYWGTSTGSYTQNSGNIGNVTTYKLTLPTTEHYFIAVTAIDDTGLESDFSNEVNTVGPSAPGGCKIKVD